MSADGGLAQDVALALVASRLKRHGWVEIPALGASMYPFIRSGDICRFCAAPNPSEIRVGDILLYPAGNGHLIGHRVVSVVRGAKQAGDYHFVCKGDSNRASDPLVPASLVLGRLLHVRKSRLRVSMKGCTARLWTFWILRSKLLASIIRWHLRK